MLDLILSNGDYVQKLISCDGTTIFNLFCQRDIVFVCDISVTGTHGGAGADVPNRILKEAVKFLMSQIQ